MTEPLPSADQAALQRRRFLRGGALLAAAAGGAVAATAGSALPASAATGGDVVLGRADNDAGTATTGVSTEGPAVAALQLTNPQGATLRLVPIGESVPEQYGLPVGSVVNTDYGPFVSVVDEDRGSFLTFVATGDDLMTLPVTRAFTPTRVFDSKARRGIVVDKSSNGALDSKGRLVKGAWVDVKVADTDLDTYPIAAAVTLGSSGSKKDGYLNVWGGGNRPAGTVSLSFLKGKTLSAGAYSEVVLNRSKKAFTVRVYASQTTHVTIDLSGLTRYGYPGPDFGDDAPGRVARRAARARRSRAAGGR